MYSVIHGGIYEELRKESFEILNSLPFDGHCIGGSLGKTKSELANIMKFMGSLLNENKKPIHLLGIGDLENIEISLPYGIDTFDSAYPSKLGRNGKLLTKSGKVDVNTAKYKEDFNKGIENCQCYSCKNYTNSLLYHLYRSGEPVAQMLGTIHNLEMMSSIMADFREKILNNEI